MSYQHSPPRATAISTMPHTAGESPQMRPSSVQMTPQRRPPITPSNSVQNIREIADFFQARR